MGLGWDSVLSRDTIRSLEGVGDAVGRIKDGAVIQYNEMRKDPDSTVDNLAFGTAAGLSSIVGDVADVANAIPNPIAKAIFNKTGNPFSFISKKAHEFSDEMMDRTDPGSAAANGAKYLAQMFPAERAVAGVRALTKASKVKAKASMTEAQYDAKKWNWAQKETPKMAPAKNLTPLEIKANRDNWHSKADPMFKNADGSAKVWYRGTRRDQGVDFSPRDTKADYHDYDGHKFFTDDPDFAESFSKNGTGSNIAPLNINAEKVYDPMNSKHGEEFANFLRKNDGNKKYDIPANGPIPATKWFDKDDVDQILHEMKDQERGWMASEFPPFFDFLRENKYNGSIVFEKGKKNFMGNRAEDIKSVFNDGSYSDPKNILRGSMGLGAVGLSESYRQNQNNTGVQ